MEAPCNFQPVKRNLIPEQGITYEIGRSILSLSWMIAGLFLSRAPSYRSGLYYGVPRLPSTQDVILGLGFLALAVATLRRLRTCVRQGGLETVIMTFYSLILFTSAIRAVWFLIPTSVSFGNGYLCVR